jgi:hypothetical protein
LNLRRKLIPLTYHVSAFVHLAITAEKLVGIVGVEPTSVRLKVGDNKPLYDIPKNNKLVRREVLETSSLASQASALPLELPKGYKTGPPRLN